MTETDHAVTRVTATRRYVRRRNGVYPPLKINLEVNVLLALQTAARALGKDSPQLLAASLLSKIVADNLYQAVLDE